MLQGVRGAGLREIRIDGARESALVVGQSEDVRIAGLQVSGTSSGDGLRLTKGTRNVSLADIEIDGAAAAGLRVSDDTRNVSMDRVSVSGSGGDGLTIENASCVEAAGLL